MQKKTSKKTVFKPRHHLIDRTTTVYLLSNTLYASSYDTVNHQWIIAAVDGGHKPQLRHPITLNDHHYNLPKNFDLSKLNPEKYAVSHHTSPAFDKLLVVSTPTPVSDDISVNYYTKKSFNDCTLFALRDGGRLWGCLPSTDNWFNLSSRLFDDLTIFKRKIYAVDREGRLYLINIYLKTKSLILGKTLIDHPVAPCSGRFGWRKRFFNYCNQLYIVVRTEENLIKVYKLVCRDKVFNWEEFLGFDYPHPTLFMGRDHYFVIYDKPENFPGKEYKNCIVFSEGAFPQYGKDCWEFTQCGDGGVCRSEDDIAIFRLNDGCFGREGENGEFPRINWSPAPWVFDAWSDIAAKYQTCLSSEFHSQSERELEADRDQMDGEVQSDVKDSNHKHGKDGDMQSVLVGQEKEQEGMTYGSDIQDRDGIMLCDLKSEQNENEDVTRTLLSMNGGNGQGTLMKNITQSIPRACTPCTTKSHGSDAVTTKFEGFDVISDLVPTLQHIWRNHGNITENSSIRSGDIIARALESLATVVRMLEDNSAKYLSDSQADFLSTTLSDLRYMHFKVWWLIPFVEKALELHKSKHLLDSLKNLSQLCTQFKKRRTILIDELTKLGEEEDKVKEEMAKVSKTIPFSGEAEFDKPVGSGLT